jgi:hypothetical protein
LRRVENDVPAVGALADQVERLVDREAELHVAAALVAAAGATPVEFADQVEKEFVDRVERALFARHGEHEDGAHAAVAQGAGADAQAHVEGRGVVRDGEQAAQPPLEGAHGDPRSACGEASTGRPLTQGARGTRPPFANSQIWRRSIMCARRSSSRYR